MTVGFAHYEDFRAAAMTIQSMRLLHPKVMPFAEFVIVDTSPLKPDGSKSPHSTALEGLCAGINNDVPCRYFHRPDLTGTSYSRREIFTQARGKVKVVTDCHVAISTGGLEAILDYFGNPENERDMLHGPILQDNLGLMGDHFDPIWGDDLMLGRWNVVFQSPDGKLYSCREGGEGRRFVDFFDFPSYAKADVGLTLAWAGHEQALVDRGWKFLASGDAPYVIPGMGLGMFAACSLPEFPEGLQGFGGEELCIHDMVRRRGGKVVCHPSAPWWHLTGYPERGDSPPYSQDLIDHRLNNYLRWFKLIGSDPAFMVSLFKNRMNTPELHARIDALVNAVFPPAPAPLPVLSELDAWYQRACDTPSDINEHAPALHALAKGCDHVVEFGVRHGVSTVAMLAAQPKKLTVYDISRQPEVKELERLKGDCEFTFINASSLVVEIEPCDVLFIDTQHTAKQLHGELMLHADKVRKFIAMHDTAVFGQHGDDGGDGLLVAIATFLSKSPDWKLYRHATNNYGFTVLARVGVVEDIPLSVELELPPPKDIPMPTPGPGDELKLMLGDIGIEAVDGCSCRAKMQQMNVWGVDGCRQHFNEIVGFMKDGAKSFGWEEPLRIKAEGQKAGIWQKIGWGLKAAASGVAFKVNWLDPFPGLVTEAIRRAEEKAEAAK